MAKNLSDYFLYVLFFLVLFAKDNMGQTVSGLDQISDFDSLFSGKRIGIVTNHTAVNNEGIHISDIFRELPGTQVTAYFGPEHGFKGNVSAGAKIDHQKKSSNIPVYSLYGKTLKPVKEMLEEVDILVFDIQDIGARFYTYIWTMALAMEAAAENNIPFIVLDRPNPINAIQVEGNILETEFATFVGLYPIVVRHGMTIGELANMFNGEGWLKDNIKADLTVIKIKNWNRGMWYDQSGLAFLAPSPNMPNLETAIVYPGLCLLEGTNISEGRGTDQPFLQFGSPWINSQTLTDSLNALNIPGIIFSPTEYIPVDIPGKAVNPKYENRKCYGVKIKITERDVFNSYLSGIKIVNKVFQLYADKLEFREKHFDRLCGTDKIRKAILENKIIDIFKLIEADEKTFIKQRQKYLIY